MQNQSEILDDLRRVMEFYLELGYEYLSVKESDISSILKETVREDNVLYSKAGGVYADSPVREDILRSLKEEIGDCSLCRLSQGRKNIVFGEGNLKAELMFIGEGPGREEDIQARPFVGDAGKVLTSLINKMGYSREDVYIANVVKCRPPMNRNPEKDEIGLCLPFLKRQIDIIRPRVIMCLGAVASHILIGTKTPISRLRGQFYMFNDIPVMPTFHPAYLMRNPKDKWLTWDDAQKVLERLKQ